MDRAHAPVAGERKAPAFTRLETITAIAVCGVLALALGLIAWTMPTTDQDDHALRYHQGGTFHYSAEAPADSVYGPDGLGTGDPILGTVTGPVTARFDYRLDTPARLQVKGTSRLVAVVHTAQGLTREFPVADRASFSGGRARVSGVLPVRAITAYVSRVEAATGGTGGPTSTVVVTPRISVQGSLDGHRLATSFSPELSFDVNGTTLRLTQPMGAVDPSAALKPTKDGKLGYHAVTTKVFSLLLLEPTVSTVRSLGTGLGLVCLLLALWLARPLWRPRGAVGERSRIQALYGSRLVDVRNLALPDGPVADVTDMDALAEIAKRYESVILHVSEPEAYLVWDNGMLYRYRPATTLRPLAQHVAREAQLQ